MTSTDELWRYDGKRVVVTGCASGIGEHVARQLTDLGAEVVGLDVRRPALQLKEFHEVDLSDPASIDQAAATVASADGPLIDRGGVPLGIGEPGRVGTIKLLDNRPVSKALNPAMS